MSDDVKAESAKFWADFQVASKALQAEFENAKDDANQLAAVKRQLLSLEKKVLDASIYLPAYDQRQCNLQIQDLSQKIGAAAKPKPKFSFGAGRTAKAGGKASVKSPELDSSATAKAAEKETAVSAGGTRICGNRNAVVNVDQEGVQPGTEVYLEDLENCIVDLRKETAWGAIHAKNVTGCIILGGVVSGSVLLDGFKNTLLAVACRQIRMHNIVQARVLLQVVSSPIIEDCTGMKFGPCPPELLSKATSAQNGQDSASELLKKASLDSSIGSNRWANVEDFNWLKKQASPNWSQLLHDADADSSQDDFDRLLVEGSANEVLPRRIRDLAAWVASQTALTLIREFLYNT
ncbi:hypothetical protein HDU97_004368 [Phlyctochytrium planicorne]|nr:hypothetical protein HDU97_004368 [Phlyctochytrium planicorne]